ncbi:VpaChn25_0724 family phage protein [Endozoicomonas numazuensis]|uniref:ArsR family transcriptional regulator n=1 Tax=Endozoicomonas numazuensis TaxID=1137799 RepID=A0A081NL58_9GAMM|nr:ArsR family transcriptional regulator [Endozoicomonas numazuensis]KEQ19181.1 hypothetical protein GZ78_04080 [Endozoicomonas numazuensis]
MSLKSVFHEDQRLVILRTLADDMAGLQANESVLQTVLKAYGHDISRVLVVSHMKYLEELDLLSLNDISGILIATLKSRGEDVAAGRATVPGVKRPRAR